MIESCQKTQYITAWCVCAYIVMELSRVAKLRELDHETMEEGGLFEKSHFLSHNGDDQLHVCCLSEEMTIWYVLMKEH